jgi:hypothetical protein
MLSQYVDSYLATNAARGPGKGLTPGTFIAYTVRGRARSYAGRYVRALVSGLRKVGATPGTSCRGCRAWYPAQ